MRDLKLGEAIEVLTDPDEVVVKILPPEKEEVEEVAAAEEMPEVEVVGRKAKPEVGEEPSAKDKE